MINAERTFRQNLCLLGLVLSVAGCTSTPILPEKDQQICIDRRKAQILAVNSQFKTFLPKLDAQQFPEQSKKYFCEIPVSASEKEDNYILPTIVHEGIHTISNQPYDVVRDKYNFEGGYNFYLIDSDSLLTMRWSDQFPVLNELFDGTEELSKLKYYENYVRGRSGGRYTIFDLLNEWNAYSSEMFVYEANDYHPQCKEGWISTQAEGSRAFAVLTAGYLEKLKQTKPVLSQLLASDPSFKKILSVLLIRSEKSTTAIQNKAPCLFGVEEKRGLQTLFKNSLQILRPLTQAR